MKIADFLYQYQQDAIKYYQTFFEEYQKRAVITGIIPSSLLIKFRDMYPRGKQLRGALSVLGYQIGGGKAIKQMLKASIIMELMETSTLILDDILDDDDKRRGIDTIHKQWEKSLKVKYNKIEKYRYGQNMAITTGIVGYHLAMNIFSKLEFDGDILKKAINLYSNVMVDTGYGEAIDISSSYLTFDERRDISKNIHYFKTVQYTAMLPLKFGLTFAGVNINSPIYGNISKYAEALGNIFQIKDDILGSFGDPKITGKSNIQDLREARWTILVEILFNCLESNIDKSDLIKFKRIFSRTKLDDKQIQIIKQMFKKYDILRKINIMSNQFLQTGIKYTQKVSNNIQHQETLKDLLLFAYNRKK